MNKESANRINAIAVYKPRWLVSIIHYCRQYRR